MVVHFKDPAHIFVHLTGDNFTGGDPIDRLPALDADLNPFGLEHNPIPVGEIRIVNLDFVCIGGGLAVAICQNLVVVGELRRQGFEVRGADVDQGSYHTLTIIEFLQNPGQFVHG